MATKCLLSQQPTSNQAEDGASSSGQTTNIGATSPKSLTPVSAKHTLNLSAHVCTKAMSVHDSLRLVRLSQVSTVGSCPSLMLSGHAATESSISARRVRAWDGFLGEWSAVLPSITMIACSTAMSRNSSPAPSNSCTLLRR